MLSPLCFLRRLRRDRRGTAAVEFALLAPVLILLYCGVAELTLSMMAERRAAHAASVAGDLVAQSAQVSSSDLTDIFTVGNEILKPFPSAPLSMRLTSVTADSNGVPKVDWSQSTGGMTTLSAGTTPSNFPTTLLSAGDSVIMTEVSYGFDSPLHYVLPNTMTFHETYYLRPRKSAQVQFTG